MENIVDTIHGHEYMDRNAFETLKFLIPEANAVSQYFMMKNTAATRGLILAIAAGMIFGTAALFTRSITGLSPIAIAASRLTLGCLCMLGLIGGQRRMREAYQAARVHAATLLLLGVLASFHFWLFVLAVQKTFVAHALILVNTTPILVLVLAPILLKEPITRRDLASVSITVLGTGILVGFDALSLTTGHLVGDLCALGSALCYAVYVIMARKLRQIYAAPVIMGWFFGLGAALLWIGGAALGDDFVTLAAPPSPRSWLFLILLGIVPTGIGHLAYNLSLKSLSATTASTIALLEPVSGTVLAWICFQEAPPLTAGFGILIVLVGIGLTVFARRSVME